MFKLAIKFGIVTAIAVGAGMFVSVPKAAAYTNCPSNPANAPVNWGSTAGVHSAAMAGLVVYAHVGGYSDNNAPAPPGQGNPVSGVWYDLHSAMPGVAPFTDAQGNVVNPDERIFAYPPGSGGRWSDRNFMTGDTIFAGDGDSYSCGGWSVLGPGDDKSEQGNGYVIDCGKVVNGQYHDVLYWISSVSNPNGQSGRWELQINGSTRSNDLNHDGAAHTFTVGNGFNARIDLIWHPDRPQPQQTYPYVDGACTRLDVTNGGLYHNAGGDHPTRQHVTAGNLSVGKINGDVQNPRGTGIDGYAPDENGGDGTKTWYFFPSGSNDIDITVTQQWYKDSDPNKGWHDIDGSTQHIQKNCFSATCQVLSVTGDGPNSTVLAGGNIYAWVRMFNTSADSLPMVNPVLRASDGTLGTSSTSVASGGYYDFFMLLRAPGWSPNAYSLNFHPEYNASTDNMGYCGTGYTTGPWPIYQYFQIQPRANITAMDKENPTTVTYTNGGKLLTGPSFPVTTYGSLTKSGVGCPNATDSHATTDVYGDYDRTYVYNNPCINAGDTFCAHTTISPASGYRGPNGYPDINDANASADSACIKTVNEPYAHFQGSDLSSGGGFGKTCTVTGTGDISTYSKSAGGVSVGGNGGSGAQFGAEAMSVISGLTSASLRSNAPTALSGLTFANNDPHIGGGPPARTNGGYMGGGSSFCMPDYFDDKPSSLSTADTGVTAAAGSGNAQQYYKPAGGTLTLSGGTIANGHNQAIFVEGNVTITSNISYDSAARGSIHDIPSFYLIVKNGNIHVNPGVTRLDGVYVAQPDMTSPTTIDKTGIINSCWSAADTDPNHIYNNCKNQLVVNGSFVANKVLLTRSYSSLRYSQNGEHNLGGYAAHNCGNAGKDVPPAGPSSASDCAAEIFNFNPELDMSQPGISPSYGAASGKYDAITSLSPVL